MSNKPPRKQSNKQFIERLDEIKRLRKAARDRGDWRTVHELDADHSFVFRQWLSLPVGR